MNIKPNRNPLVSLIAGAIVGLTLGGVSAYWWLNANQPLTPELPTASDLVPRDALLMVAFSTNEEEWQQLQTFGTPETRQVLNQTLEEWRDRLIVPGNYNYQQDIQPWIGREATVALLPTRLSGDGTDSPPVPPNLEQPWSSVAFLPIADPDEAQAILTEAGSGTTEQGYQDYKGIRIREVKPATGDPFLAATLNNQMLVITNDQQAMEQVIDTVKGQPAIVSTPGYRQAFSQIAVPDPFLRLYVNAPVAREMAIANAIQPVPFWGLLPIQHNQGIATTVTLNDQGLALHSLNWLPNDSQIRYETASGVDPMPNRMPQDILAMVSGENLQKFWQNYSQRSTVNPGELANPSVLLEGIRRTTGLDPEQDLLPWMAGDFAVGLVPVPIENSSTPGLALAMLVEASDRRAADTALTKLDEVMRTRYNFEVSEATVQDQPVVKWVSRFGAVTATRGWLDGNVVFLELGFPKTSDRLLDLDAALANNSLFQAATASELSPDSGHVFVESDRLFNPNVPIPIPTLPPQGAAFIRSIRALGVTAATQDARSIRYDINLLMKQDTPAESSPGESESPASEASPSPSPSP